MKTYPVVAFTVLGVHEIPATGTRPYTLVYDGGCKICSPLADVVRRWDRGHRIEVTPSQTPGLPARFPWIPREAYARAIQLVGPDGATFQGTAAIELLLGILPRGRLISWVFHLPGVRPIADGIYRRVARNRCRMGCGADRWPATPVSRSSASGRGRRRAKERARSP